MQAGSGTAFSLLPAENATGNYVKVVQRVPVKHRVRPNGPDRRDRPGHVGRARRSRSDDGGDSRTRLDAEPLGGRRPIIPWLDRRRSLDRHLHGGARHLDRQCRAPPYRRRRSAVSDRESDLGHHQLSRRQRDHPADQRLARRRDRAQALLHGLRRAVHAQLRSCAVCRPNLPCLVAARVLQGIGGGGLAPSEQSMLADTFPPAKRGAGLRHLRRRRHRRAGVGPDASAATSPTTRPGTGYFFINVPIGAAFPDPRVTILVDEPEALAARAARAAERRAAKSTGSAFCSSRSALGCLEIVLDKGQEDDWFNSTFIVVFAIVSAPRLLRLSCRGS